MFESDIVYPMLGFAIGVLTVGLSLRYVILKYLKNVGIHDIIRDKKTKEWRIIWEKDRNV